MSAKPFARKVRPAPRKELGTRPVSAIELRPHIGYRDLIGDVIRSVFGCPKVAARATGRTPATVQNWLDGSNAMNGDTLLWLLEHDDDFCAELLERIGRVDQARRVRVAALLEQAQALLGGEE